MAFPYYPYSPNYFQTPAPDQLAQLRQNFQQSVEYATKEELNALAAKIEALTAKPVKKTTKEDAE